MYCVNCGAKIPEGAAFCESCGTPVQSVGTNTPGKKAESGSVMVLRILACAVAGFLLAALMPAIPDLMWSKGAATALPAAVLMTAAHCVLILFLTWKPFCRTLGTGFGIVAAFGVSLAVSLCLVGCVFSIGQNPTLLIPATLLYGAVLYGFGVRFGKKD